VLTLIVLSRDRVTIDEVWIGNRIFGTLTHNSWLHFTVHYYTQTHTIAHSHVFTNRFSVAASNGGHSPSSFSQTVPDPNYQLLQLSNDCLQTLSLSLYWLTPNSSQKVRVTVPLRLAVYVNQFILAPSPLRPTISIFFNWTLAVIVLNVTFSRTRGWLCRLQSLLTFASAVILESEPRETHDLILLSPTRDSPNMEGQVPVFMSPRNRMAQIYPQALGSLFVASYDSQVYGAISS
jgi:hypothetical protein